MATVLTCYYRPKPGGLCTRLRRAIDALLAGDHVVHYLAVSPFPITHARCHFHRFPWPAHKASGLLFWLAFTAISPIQLLFIGVRYRATHAFAFDSLYAVVMRPVLILRSIPLTLFIRGDVVEHHRLKGHGKLVVFTEKVLEALAIANAHLYCVSSTLTEKVLARHKYFRPRVANTLPNDVPLRRNAGHPVGPTLRIACVGILERLKNHAVVIESLRYLKCSSFHLKIFGSGPEEEALRSLANQLGIGHKVSFMGWTDSGEIWTQLDLLAFPSLHEGAPNAILEALGHRIPVVASNIPEHAEILPPACLVDNKVSAWAAKLDQILTAPHETLLSLRSEQMLYGQRLEFSWDAAVVERIVGRHQERSDFCRHL